MRLGDGLPISFLNGPQRGVVDEGWIAGRFSWSAPSQIDEIELFWVHATFRAAWHRLCHPTTAHSKLRVWVSCKGKINDCAVHGCMVNNVASSVAPLLCTCACSIFADLGKSNVLLLHAQLPGNKKYEACYKHCIVRGQSKRGQSKPKRHMRVKSMTCSILRACALAAFPAAVVGLT